MESFYNVYTRNFFRSILWGQFCPVELFDKVCTPNKRLDWKIIIWQYNIYDNNKGLLLLSEFFFEGSGVKTLESTALGMTDTLSGIMDALSTVFSLLFGEITRIVFKVCIVMTLRTVLIIRDLIMKYKNNINWWNLCNNSSRYHVSNIHLKFHEF